MGGTVQKALRFLEVEKNWQLRRCNHRLFFNLLKNKPRRVLGPTEVSACHARLLLAVHGLLQFKLQATQPDLRQAVDDLFVQEHFHLFVASLE